ncbi:MAG: ATP-binding protein [Ferruginibacter sp.]
MPYLAKNINCNDDVKCKFDDAIILVDEMVKSIRRIGTELRPSIIDDLGLNAAMEWQVFEFGQRSGIEVKFKNTFDDININPAISINLFRILQESLTNIARHSKAKQVRINLEKTGNNILLMIQDDGIGFNKTSKKNGRAFGLLGINERVAMLNGQSSIETAPGRGTNIIVVLPLH